MSNRKRSMWLVSMAALLLILASAAWAQTVTGRLLGTVQDPIGAGVPAAQVTITNQDTSISSKIQTDSVGNHVAPSLPPGAYTVKVEASRFRTAVSGGSTVSVAQATRMDVTLQVGLRRRQLPVLVPEHRQRPQLL